MDKQHLRAQGAMEFMVLAGILLLLFAIIMGIFGSQASDTNKQKIQLRAEDVVVKIQKEVHLAARVLDGYSREFTLPQRIVNKEYTLTIQGDEIVLHVMDDDFWRTIPPVVGNFTLGTNTIRKANGIIYLN